MQRRSAPIRLTFTLIELLVVIAIITLLLAVMMPAMGRVREQSRRIVCTSNLREVYACIRLYVDAGDDYLPRGPEPAHPFDFSSSSMATNQLWIGCGEGGPPVAHPMQYNGLGRLLSTVLGEPRILFCPSDDNFNYLDEHQKIGTERDAYGSYLYRQLDHLPFQARRGQLGELGANVINGRQIPVETLALDANSLGPGQFHHTNHRGQVVNILFRDGTVKLHRNEGNPYAIPTDAFSNPASIPTAIDQLLTNADCARSGESPPCIVASAGREK